MKAHVELTDTYGGESNYSWVKRATVEANTVAQIIRLAKNAVGMTNVRCRKHDFGDMIEFRPYGYALVMFITFE